MVLLLSVFGYIFADKILHYTGNYAAVSRKVIQWSAPISSFQTFCQKMTKQAGQISTSVKAPECQSIQLFIYG